MESIDEERLENIIKTVVVVVLGYSKEETLNSKLLDFDTHQRETLVKALLAVLRQALAQHLEEEAFTNLLNEKFVEQNVITKGLKEYYVKNMVNLQQHYAQRRPLNPGLVDFKWVSTLPSDSKFGLSSAQPTVKCQITTTNGAFAFNLSPEAVQNLAAEIQNIQNAIQEVK